MTRFARLLSLAALALVAAASGCTHHADLHACTPGAGERECWESELVDPSGRVRGHSIERSTPGARCDLIVVDRLAYDEAGMVTARVVEEQRCRVVERRITERFDLRTGELELEIAIDEDHDARMDVVSVDRRPMTAAQQAFASAPTPHTMSARQGLASR